MKDKIIMVKFGRKTYPTHIVNGVQRFIRNEENCKKFETGEINLNKLAYDVIEGRMSKTEFLELRMSLGMSVSGLWDAYPGYKIDNPLWN